MANTTKLYQDGSDILLTSNNGNYIIKNDGVYKTTRTGAELTEISFDIDVQTALDNATQASEERVSYDACKMLAITITEKIEDFE